MNENTFVYIDSRMKEQIDRFFAVSFIQETGRLCSRLEMSANVFSVAINLSFPPFFLPRMNLSLGLFIS